MRFALAHGKHWWSAALGDVHMYGPVAVIVEHDHTILVVCQEASAAGWLGTRRRIDHRTCPRTDQRCRDDPIDN